MDRTLFWTATNLEASYSIFNIIVMSIERTPDAKGARRQRASMPITH